MPVAESQIFLNSKVFIKVLALKHFVVIELGNTNVKVTW